MMFFRRTINRLVICGILLCMLTLLLSYFEHFKGLASLIGKPWDGNFCSLLDKEEMVTIGDKRLVDVTEVKDIPERSIFFHETSCSKDLTARQACSVESAARTNPKTQVYLLLTSSAADVGPKGGRYIRVLSTAFPNIHVHHLHMGNYVKNTPMEDWYKAGKFKKSSWIMEHTSDALRYLTLWKYGGSYVDLDVILMRSLAGMKNFAGAEGKEDIAAGILNFEGRGSFGRGVEEEIEGEKNGEKLSINTDNSGHRLAEECVQEFVSGYQADEWGYNGPGVITRVLNRNCVTSGGAEDGIWRNCTGGFKVYPPSAFYPIPYKEWKKYFSEDASVDTMKVLSEAIAAHVWNKLSSEVVVKVGSNQPYSLLAAKFCPEIYSICGDYL